MKSILTLNLLLFLILPVFSQYPTFKIDYKFIVDESLLQMDEDELDDEQKILMATAALALAFQDEDKPIAQVWTSNKFVRAKTSLYGDSYEINDKENNRHIAIYPESQQYYINSVLQDKLLDLEDSFQLASELPISYIEGQEKSIAGYTCKLAILKVVGVDDNSASINVWYTEMLPSTFWGEYAYLKNIPGAALEISTSGLGIQASSVVTEGDASIFEIPANYVQIDSPLALDFSFNTEDYESEKLDEYYLNDSLVAFLDKEINQYGIKTYDGDIVVNPQFLDIYQYDNGLAIVSNDGYNYGAIDLKGKIVIPLMYDALTYNSVDDTFIFLKDAKYGIISSTNQIVIPNEYDYISFIVNERAIVSKEDAYGIIDSKNQIVVPLKYDYIMDVVGDYFISFENDDVCVLYSFKGEKRATYPYISNAYAENLFVVMKDEKYGYINSAGKVIIPIIYEYASAFTNGLATVLQEGSEQTITINTRGEIVQE
ncbi:WG repeat-containing protein [Sphingobacterium composti Ten et al. 2007 non Yoo et al. 2007]|uniref:WG repeat-containing protein n=1 Tax=Sphingobacterium composti TaxID=363260 RepID=UPI00135CC219|nr:WG repeat-containing protein [Sphingobacterium composti Ten et al. 2007 non Yoo et al. 2007]